MPLQRRMRVPRRGRRSSFRKRRLTRRRRLVQRFKRRKTASRRTKLTQGFPRSATATLKYVDVIEDIRPRSQTDGSLQFIDSAPGVCAFSCNDPGAPDAGSDPGSPSLFNLIGTHPHQPLGYDQYAMLYRRAKVLRSSAKFTVTFATRDGFSLAVPSAVNHEPRVDEIVDQIGDITGTIANPNTGTSVANLTTSTPVAIAGDVNYHFPSGLYVGMLRMNSLNPLILPKTYTEFLERFKAPLKFVPYLKDKAAYKTVTLMGLYVAPKTSRLRSLISFGDQFGTGLTGDRWDRMADMLTTRTGDHSYTAYDGSTVEPREGFKATPPTAKYYWKLVVYYPNPGSPASYVLPDPSDPTQLVDHISMRATVNIRYRVRFSALRQLRTSYLETTPGVNEQAGAGAGLPVAGGGTAPMTHQDMLEAQNELGVPSHEFNDQELVDSPVSDEELPR